MNESTMDQFGMHPPILSERDNQLLNAEKKTGAEAGKYYLNRSKEQLAGFYGNTAEIWSSAIKQNTTSLGQFIKRSAVMGAHELMNHPAIGQLARDIPDTPGEIGAALFMLALPYILKMIKKEG